MSEINERISHKDILEQKVDGKKKWNVQSLRSKIRELTKEANLILLENEDRQDYKLLAARIQEATNAGAADSDRFVGRLNFKNIQQLESQLHGLQEFIEYDTLSAEAKAKRQERFEAAKAKYQKTTNQKNLSDVEYERQLHTLSSISSLIDKYGSTNLRNLNEELEKKNKDKLAGGTSLITAIKRAEKYADENNIRKDPENILDIVYAQEGINRRK